MEPNDVEVAALVSTHKAPLGEDTIPDENQAHHCFSCKAPMTGLYCSACGQKNDDFRRSILKLLKETVSSLTGLESRIWRTWGALLLKPGKVAREYADGQRTTWSSPVRAFLAMSIILFGYMSVTGTQLISVDLHPELKPGIAKPAEQLTDSDYGINGGVYLFKSRKAIQKQISETDFDLLERKLRGIDELGLGADPDGTAGTPIKREGKPIIDRLQINSKDVDVDEGISNLVDIIRDPRDLNAVFYTWLPRIMFLMMPFSMLIGALFIRGRGNALLYDHLVHAAYIHAVLYFLIFVGILSSRVTSSPIIGLGIFLCMLIYLPLSLKHMFNRGWFKTIWTAYGVGLIYVFNIVIIILGLLILGMGQTFEPTS